MNDRIKRVEYTYTTNYYSRKKGNPAICNNMDESESIMLRKIIRERETVCEPPIHGILKSTTHRNRVEKWFSGISG